jgi:hypothetical protein
MASQSQEGEAAMATERNDSAVLLNDYYKQMSIEELLLLNDEDESQLEEREAALRSIRQYCAHAAVNSELSRHHYEQLRARYDAIERNVKALRRNRNRTNINCRLSDGSRIFDLEVAQ